MSLTNPNTVVTEQRLSDFYQGILPYLGGMPEMVANKFSKGDLYSTDEKMIGQWINGKPVYQRTYQLATPITLTANAWNNIDSVDTTGVEKLIDAKFYYGTSTMTNLRLMGTSTILYVYNQGDAVANVNIITLKYTKTADSAISIGDANDYSTEEKIIGTWVDGKPLYQKTIQSTVPTVASGATADELTSLTSLNIDALIMCQGVSKTLESVPTIGYSSTVAKYVGCIQCFYNNNNKNLYVRNIGMVNDNAKTIYVTIQYTKTTD